MLGDTERAGRASDREIRLGQTLSGTTCSTTTTVAATISYYSCPARYTLSASK